MARGGREAKRGVEGLLNAIVPLPHKSDNDDKTPAGVRGWMTIALGQEGVQRRRLRPSRAAVTSVGSESLTMGQLDLATFTCLGECSRDAHQLAGCKTVNGIAGMQRSGQVMQALSGTRCKTLTRPEPSARGQEPPWLVPLPATMFDRGRVTRPAHHRTRRDGFVLLDGGNCGVRRRRLGRRQQCGVSRQGRQADRQTDRHTRTHTHGGREREVVNARPRRTIVRSMAAGDVETQADDALVLADQQHHERLAAFAQGSESTSRPTVTQSSLTAKPPIAHFAAPPCWSWLQLAASAGPPFRLHSIHFLATTHIRQLPAVD
ncbi:hypothetical protein BKA66DRAFT_602248 [Pyrenochaeta sp. MPI-SDFR-AT-0127]|nr:hypothetical protein BKA66DRAFT_602248 [Pyrenochaeta sp. MPI-SDFR-AT-0127]